MPTTVTIGKLVTMLVIKAITLGYNANLAAFATSWTASSFVVLATRANINNSIGVSSILSSHLSTGEGRTALLARYITDEEDFNSVADALAASHTVPQLKEKLREQKLPVTGKKMELIYRLLGEAPITKIKSNADSSDAVNSTHTKENDVAPTLPSDAIIIEACKS